MRYWKPWRKAVIALTCALAWWPWAEDRLLDYLYPSDAIYRFTDGPK